MTIKWKILDSKTFTGESNGYSICIKLGGIYPYWEIMKDDIIIDKASYHSPVTSNSNKELACKVQAERYLNLIQNNE